MSHPVREDQLPRSVAEFHAWHARQPERWEYVGGVPRPMAPASTNHSWIKKNITTAFDNALGDGPCVALPDGVEVEAEDLVAQPDAVITCALIDHATPVVREPVVIVEAVSPSSQADDTVHKLAASYGFPVNPSRLKRWYPWRALPEGVVGRARFGVADHLGLEELTARYRAARDPVGRGRWQMVRLLVAGRSLAEVADVTGYGTRWVREVVRRHDAGGPDAPADRRHANPGAAPLLDAVGRQALEAALDDPPPEGGRWTCAKVAAWVAARTGRERVPAQRGWAYLRRTGHSPRVPRPRHVRAADPAAQAAFQKA